MPLELPTLDDRRYADLMDEALRLIPVHDPDWTNHNPSDPGITLIELFAWLTEMLLYRLDRVTEENQRNFLKLLNVGALDGFAPPDSGDLQADIRATVLALRARERAVTAADYEELATGAFNRWLARMRLAGQAGAVPPEWWQTTSLDPGDPTHSPAAVPAVARAACVPSRNLDRGNETDRAMDAPGHVSLIVLPARPSTAPTDPPVDLSQPPLALRSALWGWLDARRMLTTRHHVVGPVYAPVSAEVVIAAAAGALPQKVAGRVLDRLVAFLDPQTGGDAGTGWPFGRDVYVSELLEQLEQVEGVDYITDLMLASDCAPDDRRCRAASPDWHPEGDLIGLALGGHHLPLPRLDANAIVVAPATAFVRAALDVTLTATATATPATLKQQARAAVRQFLHPLHGGPGPTRQTATNLWLWPPEDEAGPGLAEALAKIDGITAVEITLDAPEDRLLRPEGQIIGFLTAPGEVVNWRASVSIQPAAA